MDSPLPPTPHPLPDGPDGGKMQHVSILWREEGPGEPGGAGAVDGRWDCRLMHPFDRKAAKLACPLCPEHEDMVRRLGGVGAASRQDVTGRCGRSWKGRRPLLPPVGSHRPSGGTTTRPTSGGASCWTSA